LAAAPQRPITHNSQKALRQLSAPEVSYKCRRSGWASALEPRKLSREDVTRLYHEHGPALLAYASSFVADRALGEDLLHQVFAKLLEGATSLPDVPAAYLYRAVRNAALNTRRNGFRETALDATNSCFVHRGGDNEAALALQVALAELPDEQREAVVMRIWSGMTLDEVAPATGVSLNTVASRYRYALQKLREKLKPFQKTEEL
jgi:RNA polymerase sigma-70 factor (ECF subfamily)